MCKGYYGEGIAGSFQRNSFQPSFALLLSVLGRRKPASNPNRATYNEEESFLYLGCKIELSSFRLASSSSQILLAPPFSLPVRENISSEWSDHLPLSHPFSLFHSYPLFNQHAQVKESLMKRIGYSLEKIIRQEFNVGELWLKTPG